MYLVFLLAAQITPMQPMPKGTGLPPPGTEEAQVMAPVDALLAGIAAKDSSAILRAMRPDGSVTVALERADGGRTVKHMSAAEFVQGIKPGPERLEERLNDPAIEVDGDIAMVWSPYTFFIDGKVSHCGTDHFDLVRENGSWKVQNLTWSKRTMGCGG